MNIPPSLRLSRAAAHRGCAPARPAQGHRFDVLSKVCRTLLSLLDTAAIAQRMSPSLPRPVSRVPIPENRVFPFVNQLISASKGIIRRGIVLASLCKKYTELLVLSDCVVVECVIV